MALLSWIACASGLTEQLYQRWPHAICDSKLVFDVSRQGGWIVNREPAPHSDFPYLDAE